MSWEDIQIELRHRLGELFDNEQSIRTIVRDVDGSLEASIRWHGSALECWSEVLKKVRILHFELKLMKVVRRGVYSQDQVLQKAENDIKVLLEKEKQTSGGSAPTGEEETPTPHGPEPINVFISYSVKDEKSKEQLETHLALLKRAKTILPWHSQQVKLGLGHDQGITDLINAAQIILLLISPSFLAEDETYEKEMLLAIERQKKGEAVRVIPIKIHEVLRGDPSVAPFQGLQGLPRSGKPVDTWRNADEIWASIANDIRQVCNELNGISDKK